MFEGFEVKDVEFSFVGLKGSGIVSVKLGGKEMGELRVIEDGGKWKIDELPSGG